MALLRERAQAEAAIEAIVQDGAAASLDEASAAADDRHAFLRAAWFDAVGHPSSAITLTGLRETGDAIAAIPVILRKKAFLRLREVPGSYWPYRSFPIARSASDAELISLLGSREAKSALGAAWRVGPIYSNDPTGNRLVDVARRSGWTLLQRRLGTCFAIDLKKRRAEGPWPSGSTLRKNRWCEKRLAERGELEFRFIEGSDWGDDVMDALAHIESESWVGKNGGDAKFLDPRNRNIWERAIADPVIAPMLSCALLSIGGIPAAFTFALQSGGTRYMIANSYSERFAKHGPGRVLLYRDFQKAAEDGVETISWGAGDPGYKSEMGAEAGPGIVDYLIVRGPMLAALLRPFWERSPPDA